MGSGQKIESLETQNAELRHQVGMLKAALYAAGARLEGSTYQRAEWAEHMTPQQIAVCMMLKEAYPAALNKWDMLEAMPGHTEDRDVKIVAVMVHYIKKALGQDAIACERGFGYRLTAAGVKALEEPQQLMLKAA